MRASRGAPGGGVAPASCWDVGLSSEEATVGRLQMSLFYGEKSSRPRHRRGGRGGFSSSAAVRPAGSRARAEPFAFDGLARGETSYASVLRLSVSLGAASVSTDFSRLKAIRGVCAAVLTSDSSFLCLRHKIL